MNFHYSRRRKALFAGFSLIFLTAAFIGIEKIHDLYAAEQQAERKAILDQRLALVRSTIEALIYRETYIADSLATVLSVSPQETTDNWPAIAKRLFHKSRIARNVGVAPDNIIQYTYPNTNNQSSIGFDFRTSPEQMVTVQRAMELQDVYLTNPVSLVQGGRGIIARFPIFTDAPHNTQYWGTVSVVMDYEKFLQEIDIDQFTDASIALSGQADEVSRQPVFYGSPQTFAEADAILPISIPNGTWRIAANYHLASWQQPFLSQHAVRLVGWLVALAVLLSTLMAWRALLLSRSIARQDELTGLPNRRYLMEQLNSIVNQRKTRSFSLLNIDLNGFKAVNDTHGHLAGDQLLRLVANGLYNNVRSYDEVVRIGGDEFVVILHRLTDPQRIERKIEKLRATIEHSSIQWHGDAISPSLSFGYAIYDGTPISVAELLSEADRNMYRDKRSKRL